MLKLLHNFCLSKFLQWDVVAGQSAKLIATERNHEFPLRKFGRALLKDQTKELVDEELVKARRLGHFIAPALSFALFLGGRLKKVKLGL